MKMPNLNFTKLSLLGNTKLDDIENDLPAASAFKELKKKKKRKS